jgi:RHS repeat-associated protein
VTPGSNRLSAATYDAAGNLTASGTMHYGYDAAGMLNTIRLGDDLQPRLIYAYTADDERLFAFDVATGTTHWTLRGFDNKVLRDFKQQGATWSVERDYVYRDGLLLAALRPDGAVEHYSLDHLGTPRLVTDGAGHKIGSHAYWPFGEEWTPGGLQQGAPLKFTGHERDADPSGGAAPLDYMHARYYGPAWGRFLSVDPAGNDNTADPQKWNRYLYARDNPLKFTDADGRKERIFVDNRTTGPTRAGVNMQAVVIQMRAKYVAARVDVSVEQGNPQVREIARAHLDGDHVRVIRLVDQPSPTDTPLATRAIGHAGAGMPPEVHVNRVAPDNPATPRDERATAVANAATHEVGHQQGLEHNDNSAQDVMKGSPAQGTLTTPRQFNATDAQILRELPPP